MPDNDVCWPANGEIDIMEMVNGDGTLHGTYHWQEDGNCADQPFTHPSVTGGVNVADFGDVYHEYGVQYGPEGISFALDRDVYKSLVAGVDVSDTGTEGLPLQMFDVPYYFKLNTAVGGPWPGEPDDGTVFPAYHYIDYVRVGKKKKVNKE